MELKANLIFYILIAKNMYYNISKLFTYIILLTYLNDPLIGLCWSETLIKFSTLNEIEKKIHSCKKNWTVVFKHTHVMLRQIFLASSTEL